MHVRASFRTPTRLKSHRSELLIATGRVQEAQLAANGEREPLAYGKVSESGKARIFTARSCVPD